ncbi:protein kinase [Streptomyces sp. NPDC006610]|uniref:serine/threonine-protein kinase n=1 Tax=Streptomyces sp. NPDC006610 TaxID=3154584 RepID=UPI0033AD7621
MEKLGPGDSPRIGAYRLLARLGAGGMGHVYLARSDRGRTVAVKLVRRELAAREEFRARFRQEVQAARQVGGHWTAPVLDADTEAPVPWVATGYVAGPSLERVVARQHGALPERSVRILAAGLAHALRDIHAAGIVHRDLKPSNVLVTIDGPRVIDFGIARAMETVSEGGLTRTGALVGSPGFMAPEQVRGDRITPACDVFCLGSVLAYAATGAMPFGDADSGVHALMFRIAQEEPDLSRVPEGLADLVRDCLRKDPAARPTLERILERTGAEDTVSDGRSRDPWLPGALVAQLGRHAVRLLDTEDPQTASLTLPRSPSPEHASPSPEHSPAPDETPAATPGRPAPTAVPPGPGATPPSHPAYGYPHQAYGHPQQPQGPAGPGGYGQPAPYNPYSTAATPPYGPPPYGPPPEESRRSGRGTAALVAVALVVALGAGGSVYALLSGDGDGDDVKAGPTATATADGDRVTSGPTGASSPPPSPSPSPSASQDGAIPADYVGAWAADTGADGSDTRRLTLRQGEVGDTVLTLVADGPAEGGGRYHCEFEADLAADPGTDGPVRIGPSRVTAGEAPTCAPGPATEITLLPDGTLERVNTATGETVTYNEQ